MTSRTLHEHLHYTIYIKNKLEEWRAQNLLQAGIIHGFSELAASSSQNSLPGYSSLVCLHEEDVPGASLNRSGSCQLHVVELKCWLKCRAATTVGKKHDLVKR